MRLSVKRNDKLEGYAEVPITVLVELYDEDRDLEESIEKNILNNETASFEFESHEFDITCLVGGWTIRDWIGVHGTEPLTLPCGLKKSHLTYLDGYKSEIGNEKKSKLGQEDDHQQVIAQQLHPSQVIDRKKQAIGLAIMSVAMIAGAMGIFILTEHKFSDYAPLGWLLAAIGAIGLIVAGVTIEGSGANDSRCKKCRSNKIRFLKEDEEYKGTYSKQENVLNKNTGYTEFARVTKTDFWVTEYYKCDLCSHAWTKSYTRSTTSN